MLGERKVRGQRWAVIGQEIEKREVGHVEKKCVKTVEKGYSY